MKKKKFRFCKCGCRRRVSKEENRYIHGHIGCNTAGNIAWNKGLTKETDERLRKQSESLKLIFSSKKWKNTKGKEKIKKMKLTINSKKWKETVGKEKIRKIKKTKNSSKYKKTTGLEFSKKMNKNRKERGRKISKALKGKPQRKEVVEKMKQTMKSKNWKETKGKEMIKKHKHTVNAKEWINTKGKEKIKKYKHTISSEEYKNTKRKEKIRKLKAKWKTVEHIKKLRKSLNLKPNKKEQLLIKLFKKHKLLYKYTGDLKVTINGFCPDFISKNGQKKIIECNGSYWHTKMSAKKYGIKTRKQEEQRKARRYAKEGYRTLFIWEDELKDLDKVLEKVKKFDRK